MSTPEYDGPEDSVESGSGTPEPAATRAAGEQTIDDRESSTLPATGTLGSADPQAPAASRVVAEAEAGPGGLAGSGAATRAPGADPQPPPAPEGVNQPDVGVADTDGNNVSGVDPGRKSGAVTPSETVLAERRHAPDGEVGPV